jgi:hypothetical protein
MKHKRSEFGFSLHLFLILIVIIAAIGFSGWYVISRHSPVQDNGWSSADNFIPGDISVTFNDGVTFQKALDLIKSYGLTVDKPEAYNDDFTPESYRAIKMDHFNQIQNNLKGYPEVVSFIDDSLDPANNRAGAGEKWVKVTWRQDVTYDRIKAILVASGLGLSNQPQGVNRTVYLKVPDGQEGSYISKFKQNSIVKNADRVGRPVAQ